SDRNAFGTLSRPLSSIRAGALPLNTRWPTSIGHLTPQKSTAIVEKAQLEVNRKIYGISNLRKISYASIQSIVNVAKFCIHPKIGLSISFGERFSVCP